MRVFIQKTPPSSGVYGGGPTRFGDEIIKLVIATENYSETADVRKRIKRYYTATQIDSRGHTFMFDRPDDKTYFKIEREELSNWSHHVKNIQQQLPMGAQGYYGFWFKGQVHIFEDITGDGNLIHQLLNQLNTSYEQILIPFGSDKDKDEKTLPWCGTHEEGATPIMGWIICKKCGRNIRKAGMQ